MKKFRYTRIEWDEANVYKNEIRHRVKYYEIEEAIENEPKCIIPHKKYKDRHVLLGVTDGGRYLFLRLNSLFSRSTMFVVLKDVHSSSGNLKNVKQAFIDCRNDFTAEGSSFSHFLLNVL